MGSISRLNTRDKATVFVMLALPTDSWSWLVVVPAILTVVLGFARWEGIGGIDTIEWIGFKNYTTSSRSTRRSARRSGTT